MKFLAKFCGDRFEPQLRQQTIKSMKRKAPETLLEFVDYIHSSTKRFKHDYSTWTSSPNSSISSDIDSSESPAQYSLSAESAGEEGVTSPRFTESNSDSDFDIGVIIEPTFTAQKPINCRKPHKTLVQAVRWFVEHKSVLQRHISDAIGVSPSTLSLYMNDTPRQHGWRELEKSLLEWMRNRISSTDIPRQDDSSVNTLNHDEFGACSAEESDYESYYSSIATGSAIISPLPSDFVLYPLAASYSFE